MADPVKVEEAEILAYMGSEVELPSVADRKSYFLKRLGNVRDVYLYLKLQQEEADAYKDKGYREQTIGKLQKLFRENYTERVTVVTELRKMGEKVDDPFVPLSKV